MSTQHFTVAGMSCGHCVAAVTDEVSKIAGVTSVAVDLPSGGVTVEGGSPITYEAFAAAVDEAGFEVVPA